MIIVNSSLQTPSMMESTQIAQSVHQNNRSVDDAIAEFNVQEVQKNQSNFDENLAVMGAQLTGKGLSLDLRG